MPFQYSRDDTARRVRLTASDPIVLVDMIDVLDRQLADGAWAYAALVDMRMVSSPATGSDLRAFTAHFRELVAEHGTRGPLVIVATNAGTIGSAQMYASVGGAEKRPFEVFWDIDLAERWLSSQKS